MYRSRRLNLTIPFRRLNIRKLEVDVAIEDPKAYRTPIVYKRRATLIPDEDLLEYFCIENEKDAPHYQK